MRSIHLLLQTLSESGTGLRIDPIQGDLRRNRPTPIPAAGEERSTGLEGGATCVANAPRLVGYREPLHAATVCRNTREAQAKPAGNPPTADQKKDDKLPRERV